MIRTIAEAPDRLRAENNRIRMARKAERIRFSSKPVETNFSGNAFLTQEQVRANSEMAKIAQSITAW